MRYSKLLFVAIFLSPVCAFAAGTGVPNSPGGAAPTTGQTTMSGSLPVVISSDQSPVQVSVPSGVSATITSPVDGNANILVAPVDSGGTTMTRTSDHSLNVNVTGSTGVAQGSTSSGQTLAPTGCRTLTSAPTDTTATTNMPWCRTNGTRASDLTSINGTTVSTGTGAQGSGTQRVTVATDSATVAGSASLPAGTNTVGNVNLVTNNASTGLIQGSTTAAISSTAAATAQVIALSGSTVTYVTHYEIVFSGAGTFAWVYGTGTNCATGTTYLSGASGHPMSFAANGGISAGAGLGPILVVPSGKALCMVTTGSVDISGSITYAQF